MWDIFCNVWPEKKTSKVNSNKFLPKRHFPNTTVFQRYDPFHRVEKINYRYLCGILLENINWEIAISPLKICIFYFEYNEGFILSSLLLLQYLFTFRSSDLNFCENGLRRVHVVSNKNIISFIDWRRKGRFTECWK